MCTRVSACMHMFVCKCDVCACAKMGSIRLTINIQHVKQNVGVQKYAVLHSLNIMHMIIQLLSDRHRSSSEISFHC